MKLLQDCQLYTFVDTAYLRGRAPEEAARQLCAGGSDLIQLRAKGAPVADVRRLAEKLLPVVEAAGVGLVINDFPGIAAEIGAPLCHLGQEDFSEAGHAKVSDIVAAVQGLSSTRQPLQIGLSTHAPDEARRALEAGASYIAIGPVHATGTKPSAKPVTLEYVRWAAQNVSTPWFAIGGITLLNLDAVLEAGARRICVVSAILCAPDIAKACQAFKDRLRSARRAGV
jgi:thiamine-phosphate pyrophosphorylase